MFYAVMPQIYYILVAQHAGLKDYSQILKHTESEICRMATYDSIFSTAKPIAGRRFRRVFGVLPVLLFCHNVCLERLP